jgi:hypothetical protein
MKPADTEGVRVFAKAVSTGFLLWAAFGHTHGNFYVLLRITVFLTSVVCLYLSKRNWPRVAFYGTIAILFNPFLPLTFERSTWGLIDLTIGGLLGLSIFFEHSPHFGWFWASTLLAVGGLACVISVSQAAVTGFRLSREGVRVAAAITNADEVHEEGGYSYSIAYRFKTTDGQWLVGHASDRSKVPEPAVVVYYPKDPEQNYLIDHDLSIFNGATKEADILVKIAVGIVCFIWMCYLSQEGLRQIRLAKAGTVQP